MRCAGTNRVLVVPWLNSCATAKPSASSSAGGADMVTASGAGVLSAAPPQLLCGTLRHNACVLRVMARATWLARGLAPSKTRERSCSCVHRGSCQGSRSRGVAASPPRALLDGQAYSPGNDSRLVLFAASDFELVSRLGTVSYAQRSGSTQRLSWTVTEQDAVPDVLAVTDTAAVSRLAGAVADGANAAGGASDGRPDDEREPAVTLFAARCTTASVAPVRVLLKAYHAPQLGAAELAAYEALSLRCSDGAATFWLSSDLPAWAEAPLAPVVGFFFAAVPFAPGKGLYDSREVLWVVQRWVPLTSLATLATCLVVPSRSAPAARSSSWLDALIQIMNPFEAATPTTPAAPPPPPPPSRDRDAAIVRACVGAVAALAFLHSKRIAHGSLDAKCFLMDAGSGTVRLTNLGFSTIGTDADGAQEQQALADAAQQDCRALGGAIAEAVFGGLSTEVR